MKRTIFTAIALSLAFLPLAGDAYAQACGPNALACVPPPGNPPAVWSGSEVHVPTPIVCFYMAPDFKGPYFCEAGRRTVSAVPVQWRNKIKSLTVSDNTTVRVCPADVLQGNCNTIDRNTKKLEPGLFNHVYSYAIRQTY